MLRTFTFCLISALVGGALVAAWNHRADEIASAAVPVASTPAASEPSPAPTPPSRLDFIADASVPWQVRIDRLRTGLQDQCGETDIRALYKMLAAGCPQGEVEEHWYVIANDIINQLLAYETDANRFHTFFVGLLEDPSQPEVIRDYSVQCLGSWLNPSAAQNGASLLPAPSTENTAEILRVLAATTISPELEQTSIPGTSLMLLVDLKRAGTVNCDEAVALLKPWLNQALGEGSSLSHPVRVSAVTAAAILSPDDFRPALRKIAYDEKGNPALRLPAVAALGYAGDAEDSPKLAHLAATSPELTYAAQEAGRILAARSPDR